MLDEQSGGNLYDGSFAARYIAFSRTVPEKEVLQGQQVARLPLRRVSTLRNIQLRVWCNCPSGIHIRVRLQAPVWQSPTIFTDVIQHI